MATFVIEHLEPSVYKWCTIEYAHMSKRVGKANLMFTNVSKGAGKIKALGDVRKDSIKDIPLKKACVLDPAAKRLLTPEEAKKFDYFIFGGILGDNPQRFRTKKLITSKLKLPAYNLGDKQMSTDTAVIVCKKIVDGTPLGKLKFIEEYEIEEEPGLYRILPYRYLVEKGKVVFAPGLEHFLKKLKPKL
jgi:ribosome biogenesis SPOUT family RNA methylase Rps3